MSLNGMDYSKTVLTTKTKVELIKLVLGLNRQNKALKEQLEDKKKKEKERALRPVVNEEAITTLRLGADYPLTASWMEKVLFILKTVNRPMRSAEIIEVLMNNDVLFRTFKSKEKILSTYLTRAKTAKRILVTEKAGIRAKWYDLP